MAKIEVFNHLTGGHEEIELSFFLEKAFDGEGIDQTILDTMERGQRRTNAGLINLIEILFEKKILDFDDIELIGASNYEYSIPKREG